MATTTTVPYCDHRRAWPSYPHPALDSDGRLVLSGSILHTNSYYTVVAGILVPSTAFCRTHGVRNLSLQPTTKKRSDRISDYSQ